MTVIKKIVFVLAMAVSTTSIISCDDKDENITQTVLTPSQILSSTAWETTSAKNEAGEKVALNNAGVSNFVGFAYFKTNGSFTMFNLDDSPKMQGDWTVSADGKTRTIVAKNNAGETLFTRVVDITVLTTQEFTYRIYPDVENKAKYFDIIHTPTNHKEPTK
ncbi:DUF4822 domain-containing protein [Flavobacterium sp. xlx-214]|uniref:DUF4822 domain-containing protein n=1 Tax=unclassified Flavobacterium TaxID=196869 RepID=UPI0013D2CBD4|nr:MULTISPECIES: DUF4822 domain-containing protein [unclassified Flavobacterium]MBA5791582.1 DUF4822 domain-containing protein [Flavobacterium sp. xlx-221]QMI82830.1 DUF4822 domain-containing protein [Flavobacterium sp. xlx-214]